jgi:hypothetical protein
MGMEGVGPTYERIDNVRKLSINEGSPPFLGDVERSYDGRRRKRRQRIFQVPVEAAQHIAAPGQFVLNF